MDENRLRNPVITPNIETFFSHTLQASSANTSALFAFPFANSSDNQTFTLKDCVHTTQFDNLSIIPSSPLLGEILSQLESKHKIYKLRESLSELKDNFDRVYIDTPPANFLSFINKLKTLLINAWSKMYIGITILV